MSRYRCDACPRRGGQKEEGASSDGYVDTGRMSAGDDDELDQPRAGRIYIHIYNPGRINRFFTRIYTLIRSYIY